MQQVTPRNSGSNCQTLPPSELQNLHASSIPSQPLNQNSFYSQVCTDLNYCIQTPNSRNFHCTSRSNLQDGRPVESFTWILQTALLITALVTGAAETELPWNRISPSTSQLFSLTRDKSLFWQERCFLCKVHLWIPHFLNTSGLQFNAPKLTNLQDRTKGSWFK